MQCARQRIAFQPALGWESNGIVQLNIGPIPNGLRQQPIVVESLPCCLLRLMDPRHSSLRTGKTMEVLR